MLVAAKTHKDIQLLEAVLYARTKLKPQVLAEHERRLEECMSAEVKGA
jgi:hypothetical protein